MNNSFENNVFVNIILEDRVTVKPQMMDQELQEHIASLLKSKLEAKCSHHGYIKKSSIKLLKASVGRVQAFSLNGDVVFRTVFTADVCNPCIGSIVKAKIINTNRFGVLAESGVHVDKQYQPILEIVIPKQGSHASPEMLAEIEKLKKGDVVTVEIIGKKFELNEKKISVIGKLVNNAKVEPVGVDPDMMAFEDEVAEDDDEEANVDDVDVDEEEKDDEDEEDRNDEDKLSDEESYQDSSEDESVDDFEAGEEIGFSDEDEEGASSEDDE